MTHSPSDWERLAGPGRYPVAHAGWLVHPLRRLILPPERLVRRLGLRPGMRVLEVGCGPGYFSPALARATGPAGLTLFDAQPGMLDLARARLRGAGFPGVAAVAGLAEALPFPDAAFDRLVMVTVLGEVPEPALGVQEAARVLKPGGRLCLVEAAGDPDRLRRPQLDALTAAAGLEPDQAWPGLLTETFLYRRPEGSLSPPASA